MPKATHDQACLQLFGRRLRFLRTIENLTQQQLAEKAGISFEHMNKLERGASGPSFAVICALAKALNTEPIALFLFAVPSDFENGAESGQALAPKGLDWPRFVSRCGFWEADLLAGDVLWSASMQEVLGYRPGKVNGGLERFLRQHMPEDQQDVAATIWRSLQQGHDVNEQFHFQRRTGDLRLGWCHGLVQRDAGGRPVRAVGVLLDISELRRLEEYLLHSQGRLEEIIRTRTQQRDEMIRVLGLEVRDRQLAQESLQQTVAELETTNNELQAVCRRFEHTFSRYKTLFSDAPVGFVTLDEDGLVVEANARAEQLLGAGTPLLGKPFTACLATGLQEFSIGLRRAIYVGQGFAFEARVRGADDRNTSPPSPVSRQGSLSAGPTPDGTYLLIHMASSRTEEGKSLCLAALADISQRIWAERALSEITERYQVAVENSGDALCIVGGHPPVLLFANPRFRALFCLDDPECESPLAAVLARLHPTDRALMQQRYQARLAGDSPPSRYEVRLLQGRDILWLEFVAGRIELRGQPAVLGIFHDITARKEAAAQREWELRRLEALQALTEMHDQPIRDIMDFALQQAVELTGSEYGCIYLLNPRETRMKVYAWSARTGGRCAVPGGERSFPVSQAGIWAEAARRREPLLIDAYDDSPLKSGLPTGHVELRSVCCVPFVRRGRLHAVVGVANRETPYSQTEVRVLELLMDRCYGIWDNRKMQARLRGAKQRAEEANRKKSAWLADMSHEIRTPLSGIMGLLQLLDEGSLDPEQRHYVQLCRDSSRNLLGMLNEVLDFSRIEAGRVPRVEEPFSPGELAQQLSIFFQEQARQKGLRLACNVAEDLPRAVLGDPNRLQQVLMNLLSNAVKFTDQGEVGLSVTASPPYADQEGASWVRLIFTVSDTGHGIPEGKRQRLFQPFIRGETGTRRIPGTGLGLSIVKRLVEFMGGEVDCRSREEQGTRFICNIPFRLLPAQRGEVPYAVRGVEPVPEVLTVAEVPHCTRRILLADDDTVSLRIMEVFLRRNGCCVTLATDGDEALDLAQRQPFDVLILDLQMPGKNGAEVLEAVREGRCKAQRPDVPVLVLTAHAMPETGALLKALGVTALLVKPYPLERILELLRSLPLAGADGGDATPQAADRGADLSSAD